MRLQPEAAAIFDIDGVLAVTFPRVQKYLQKEGKADWDSFYYQQKYDDPIQPSIIFLKALHNEGYHIALFTGRPAAYRKETVQWLKDVGLQGYYEALMMREDDDYRPPQEAKQEQLDLLRSMGWRPEIAVEDHPETVEMYIEEGLMVYITPHYFCWEREERGREEPPETGLAATARKIDELAITEMEAELTREQDVTAELAAKVLSSPQIDPWWENNQSLAEALTGAVDEPIPQEYVAEEHEERGCPTEYSSPEAAEFFEGLEPVSCADVEGLMEPGWDAPEGRTYSEELTEHTALSREILMEPGYDGEADFSAETLAESDQDSNSDDLLH